MNITPTLLFFIALVLAGCKSMESEPLPQNSFGLQFTEPVKVTGNFSEELTVSLTELKDARCPQNVICIQPGWVELALLVRDRSDSARVKTAFHANSEKDKPATFQLGPQNYSLRVFNVLPVPLEGKKLRIEDYYINLAITAL